MVSKETDPTHFCLSLILSLFANCYLCLKTIQDLYTAATLKMVKFNMPVGTLGFLIQIPLQCWTALRAAVIFLSQPFICNMGLIAAVNSIFAHKVPLSQPRQDKICSIYKIIKKIKQNKNCLWMKLCTKWQLNLCSILSGKQGEPFLFVLH